ncbi:MAG: carbohydrate binding family 9 domain-containing protein [Gemmatimonadetes bacterium]|nr:carbohydrate binding family 9 domain-containing protein [Gemmatimonadota bacterium]
MLGVVSLATPLAASGQQAGSPSQVDPLDLPRPELRALRITEPIELDGVLTEEAWSRAEATDSHWIQIGPDAGFPSSEATVVRVLYDDDALYFGADLYDPDPASLISAGLDPEYDTASSDLLSVALDTFRDRSNGFVFAINPAGAVFDAQAFNDQRDVSRSWEGIVEVETRVHEDRWTLEMRIPLSTLRYDPSPGEQVWGLNFSRRIRRRNEDSYWAALPRQFRVYKFSLAGALTGLEGLEGGRNLWVKPAALVTSRDGRSVRDPGTDGDIGLDVKWGLTPGLTLDVTLNTDFSQVEVDQEQVNLDRFSLFFPELRDFFLENEGIFGFQDVQIRNYRTGSSNRSFRLFNSRRIGLGPDRRPVPILGGARLTGRAAGLELGFLGMRTRAVDPVDDGALGLPAEDFAVGRVKAPVGERGSVGAMWVHRSERASGANVTNRAYGVDANLQFLGNLVVNAYAARTGGDDGSPDSAVSEGNRDAAMLQLAWRDPLWNTSILLKHVGDAFDPAVGFVDRRGVRRLFATFGAHPRPTGIPGVLEVNPYVDVDVYTNLDGVEETRRVTPGLQVTTRDGGSLVFELRDRYERVLEPFPIAGTEVPVGAFDFTEWSARYTVPASHALSGRLSLTRGGFYDGDRTSIGVALLYRPNPHWQVSAGAQRNELDFGGRAFTANLYDARVRYAHDTRTFASLFTQYNEAADELVVNARLNLIHAPLSDLFVVFTERRRLSTDLDAGIGKGRIERGITLKLTRLLAF